MCAGDDRLYSIDLWGMRWSLVYWFAGRRLFTWYARLARYLNELSDNICQLQDASQYFRLLRSTSTVELGSTRVSAVTRIGLDGRWSHSRL